MEYFDNFICKDLQLFIIIIYTKSILEWNNNYLN